jgi:hypothetical protein
MELWIIWRAFVNNSFDIVCFKSRSQAQLLTTLCIITVLSKSLRRTGEQNSLTVRCPFYILIFMKSFRRRTSILLIFVCYCLLHINILDNKIVRHFYSSGTVKDRMFKDRMFTNQTAGAGFAKIEILYYDTPNREPNLFAEVCSLWTHKEVPIGYLKALVNTRRTTSSNRSCYRKNGCFKILF